MDKKAIKAILDKVESGTATAAEEEIAKYWLHYFQQEGIPQLSATELDEESMVILTSLMNSKGNKSVVSRRLWYPAVAAAILVITGCIWFFSVQKTKVSLAETYATDVLPGKKKATLTLSDGKKIVLSDAVSGQIARQAGVSIFMTPDGQVVYKIDPTAQVNTGTYNILSTSRAETYQIILPDGSKVWLNAASSIKYPATFTSLKKRMVELKGEAYFEITKDKQHPFVVKTAEQEIEVMGTHFNVNAYADEEFTKTTLAEGAVRITAGKTNQGILKPGQQAVSASGQLKIGPADIDTELAWKNGYFRFNDEQLESIMKKVSRWYDIQVTYENEELKKEPFAGITTRFSNVSELLRMLELTGEVKFKIKDRQILVLDAK